MSHFFDDSNERPGRYFCEHFKQTLLRSSWYELCFKDRHHLALSACISTSVQRVKLPFQFLGPPEVGCRVTIISDFRTAKKGNGKVVFAKQAIHRISRYKKDYSTSALACCVRY